jgi:rRNA maturation endonuclease Nob1
MSFVRRCLGCSATYVADGHFCEECGSHAGEVEEAQAPEDTAPKPKPARKRKT